MNYKAEFIGRKIGAIGVRYSIECFTQGNTEDEAELLLYNIYEHITSLRMTKLPINKENKD